MLLLSCIPSESWAGFDYKLKNDRFSGTKTSSYYLTVGNECKLTATSAGKLNFCTFQNSSNNTNDPNLMFTTTSKGWDIMQYRNAAPYAEGKVPTIISYKDGKVINTLLGVKYVGETLGGRNVMEVVLVELGLIKENLSNISLIEVKYGSNEYSVVLDPILTTRALEFQE